MYSGFFFPRLALYTLNAKKKCANTRTIRWQWKMRAYWAEREYIFAVYLTPCAISFFSRNPDMRFAVWSNAWMNINCCYMCIFVCRENRLWKWLQTVCLFFFFSVCRKIFCANDAKKMCIKFGCVCECKI